MLERSAAGGPTNKHVSAPRLERLVRWCAGRLIWPELLGSLIIETPTGRRVQVGQTTGNPQVVLKMNNYKLPWKVFRRGTIGFAESYMDQDFDCPDLTGLFRFFLSNRDRFNWPGRYFQKAGKGDRAAHLLRQNSRRGSQRNISEHYDLGNEFFRLWLDPDMIYSSAKFDDGARSLEEAQNAKLNRIIELLDLTGQEDILEIGCGWGAFARLAAGIQDTRVTGVTLSHEQLAHASELAAGDGLGEKCKFLLQDYRDVPGSFDRIVSIEMIEAVGEAYWPQYFQVLSERLKPGGTAVIQAITINEHTYDRYRQNADFIQRYIFPGGMLPTPSIIERQAALAGLHLHYCEFFGLSYAETLVEWRRRFEAAWPQIAELGFDEHFRRRWHYYLTYCEAGFLHGAIDVGFYRLKKT